MASADLAYIRGLPKAELHMHLEDLFLALG